MFKYIIITPLNQSATKGTTESYRFMREYQRVRIYMNNLMDRQITDDTDGRDGIKSEGDELEVAEKELRIMA